MTELRPASPPEVAEVLREHADQDSPVRVVGAGSKSGWGTPVEAVHDRLHTSGLSGVIEHNEGDMTAILGSGTPLADASEVFAAAGQMLAIDPWLGVEPEATIGGVVATGDSGPLRHRYASTRDLVLGIQMATPDGTLARAGSKVIKNVAGYDLAKLFTGSFGSLGVITEVIVRLHPNPRERATVVGSTSSAEALGAAAGAVAVAPLELECLDVSWEDGSGKVLARVAGAETRSRTDRTTEILGEHGLDAGEVGDEAGEWDEQRRRQREPDAVVVRVSGRTTEISRVARTVSALGGSMVGRAAYGVFWVRLPAPDAAEAVPAIEELRSRLRPYACVVLDAPEDVRRKIDVWHSERVAGIEAMRRIKARFDPKATCNPGIFVGGI